MKYFINSHIETIAQPCGRTGDEYRDMSLRAALRVAKAMRKTWRVGCRASTTIDLSLLPESAADMQWINRQPRSVRKMMWHTMRVPASKAKSKAQRKWARTTLTAQLVAEERRRHAA